MTHRSTIYEVAERSGVSTATVSRVMQNGTGFSASTRSRVLAAAAELGWLPNGTARGLAHRRTGIVGVLFPDLVGEGDAEAESPLYLDQVIRGAESAATAAGDALLIAATRGAMGRERAFTVASNVDGLVVVARSLPDHNIGELARRRPTVLVSADGERLDVDSVRVDNVGGMRAVVRHLVDEHGYRDLAFVAGPTRSPDSHERFAGFCAAMRERGLPVPHRPDAVGAFIEASGARAMRALLERGRPPRAVVFGNDQMAVGALHELRAAGLRIPEDVAVTGFDDLALAKHLGLTTVAQPMRALGSCAVRGVLARLADAHAPRQATVLPTRLVLRASCGCPHAPGGAA